MSNKVSESLLVAFCSFLCADLFKKKVKELSGENFLSLSAILFFFSLIV